MKALVNFLIFTGTSCMAQTELVQNTPKQNISGGISSIQGVVENAGHNPIANANILLLKAKDSSLVKGVVSTDSGIFIFRNIPEGNYLVAATYAG